MNEHANEPEPRVVAGRRCVILGAGEYYGGERSALAAFAAEGGALVIAADGGLDHAGALGIAPDYIIGDFDSATGGAPEDAVSPTSAAGTADAAGDSASAAALSPARAIALPAQKDDTDMVSAVKVGWALGARRFLIAGGLGGRLDHTLGNLAELALVSQAGGAAWLVGDGVLATAVTDGAVSLPARPAFPAPSDTPAEGSAHAGGPADADSTAFAAGPWVGVASLSDVSHGVSIEGLKYVYEGEMRNTSAFTSNEYVGRAARVGVESGTLLVTYPLELGPDARVTRVAEVASLGALSTQVSDRLAR